MELKWKNQALFGDIVHFVGQRLFSEIPDGPNKGKLWIDVVDTAYNKFLEKIDPKLYDAEKRPIREKFTDIQIRQAVDYFKKLK
jgi:hypothetical protein